MGDPNAALQDLIEALAEWELADTDETANQAAHEAADSAQALIEWLAKGGFQPDWKRARVRGRPSSAHAEARAGHTIAWTVDYEAITAQVTCHEPQGAKCRRLYDEWGNPAADIGYCNAIQWIEDGDGWAHTHCGPRESLRDGPIVFTWADDDCTWAYKDRGKQC